MSVHAGRPAKRVNDERTRHRVLSHAPFKSDSVNTQKSTLTVLWDSGTHREFKWVSSVWGVPGEGTMVGRKPTAEGTWHSPPFVHAFDDNPWLQRLPQLPPEAQTYMPYYVGYYYASAPLSAPITTTTTTTTTKATPSTSASTSASPSTTSKPHPQHSTSTTSHPPATASTHP
ncbi:hypothetical protein M422DRAFT_268385 [Sphaerobolus stellatus SS14]|uniref:Uncharacterized protein n=1 Tax=Sphaerobolus stellatus (strain SS14) TaxID=990650 RepID=A0A0C9TK74_SPHS4|nr:hypothetical protein M422DRAFT_268385 [Sphaerobolus stellatus SS14]